MNDLIWYVVLVIIAWAFSKTVDDPVAKFIVFSATILGFMIVTGLKL